MRRNAVCFILLHFLASRRTYLHACVCMTAASPALHVADMANIKQMFLIPKSPLGLPVSLTSVRVLSDCVVCLFMAADVCVNVGALGE